MSRGYGLAPFRIAFWTALARAHHARKRGDLETWRGAMRGARLSLAMIRMLRALRGSATMHGPTVVGGREGTR